MGFVKQDILKYYNQEEDRLYLQDNRGLDLDPYYYNEVDAFFTPDECDYMTRIVLRDEEKIKAIPNPSTKPYKGLTRQHDVYNWLNHPDFQRLNIPQRLLGLKEFKDLDWVLLQCWCNVLRQGEDLHRHYHEYHPNQVIPCNMFLSGNPKTGTHYYRDAAESYTPNEVGKLTIVGHRLEHEVKTNQYQRPRVSMALDVYVKKPMYQQTVSYQNRYVLYCKSDGVSETL